VHFNIAAGKAHKYSPLLPTYFQFNSVHSSTNSSHHTLQIMTSETSPLLWQTCGAPVNTRQTWSHALGWSDSVGYLSVWSSQIVHTFSKIVSPKQQLKSGH